MGVVSWRWVWVWVESMGVASWCGCKEVYTYNYIFPHITYPYSFCISVLFYSSIPTFCSIFKMFFVLVPVLFVIKFYVLNNVFRAV